MPSKYSSTVSSSGAIYYYKTVDGKKVRVAASAVPKASKKAASKKRTSRIGRDYRAAKKRSASRAPSINRSTQKASTGAIRFNITGSAAMVRDTGKQLAARTDTQVKMYEYKATPGKITFKVSPSAVSKATKAVLISIPGMRAKITKSSRAVNMKM